MLTYDWYFIIFKNKTKYKKLSNLLIVSCFQYNTLILNIFMSVLSGLFSDLFRGLSVLTSVSALMNVVVGVVCGIGEIFQYMYA